MTLRAAAAAQLGERSALAILRALGRFRRQAFVGDRRRDLARVCLVELLTLTGGAAVLWRYEPDDPTIVEVRI